MGIFYETKVHPQVEETIRRELADDRRGADELVGQLEALRAGDVRVQTLQWRRLLVALALLAALITGGIVTEALDLDKSSDGLWALTATTLGLIVGLLGGEKAGG